LVLGVGFGVFGFGVWAQTPNPQPQIPNPQSPEILYNHYIFHKKIYKLIILVNKKIYFIFLSIQRQYIQFSILLKIALY